MNSRFASAWATLLALVAGLSISMIVQTGRSSGEDRNGDGPADVCELYDEDGDLVTVLRDRNVDGGVEARDAIAGDRVIGRDAPFSAAAQPVLLPRAIVIADPLLEGCAPVTLDSASRARCAASPTGRAPPAAL
jgi:hypothetical protein